MPKTLPPPPDEEDPEGPDPPTDVDCYEFETGEFEFEQNNVFRYKNCNWLTKKASRVDRFCDRMDTEHEQKVRMYSPILHGYSWENATD